MFVAGLLSNSQGRTVAALSTDQDATTSTSPGRKSQLTNGPEKQCYGKQTVPVTQALDAPQSDTRIQFEPAMLASTCHSECHRSKVMQLSPWVDFIHVVGPGADGRTWNSWRALSGGRRRQPSVCSVPSRARTDQDTTADHSIPEEPHRASRAPQTLSQPLQPEPLGQ